jgi:hypothetical protein
MGVEPSIQDIRQNNYHHRPHRSAAKTRLGFECGIAIPSTAVPQQ